MIKEMLKPIIVSSIILFGSIIQSNAQNVAITDDETYDADASAMLDVKSENKGFLVPRIALVSAHSPITATKPAGLLIWNTSSAGGYSIGYNYWDGSDWSPVGAGASNGLTQVGGQVELGGTLSKATTITTGGNTLGFNVNGSGAMSINLSSTGDFTIYDNNSTYSCFTFQDDGDVGIGTTAPLHALHIRDFNSNSTGTDGVYIDVQNRGNYTYEQSGIRFGNYSSTTNAFRAGMFFRRTNNPVSVDGDLYLANTSSANVTYADAALVIKPDQTIGIGTDIPGAKLDVNGSLLLQSGTSITEFSTDRNLSGNSNNAVPTEYAVKYYVDNNAGAGHTGSGTNNYIPRWTGTTGLGNSIMYENSNKIGIGTLAPTSKLVVSGNNGLTDDDPIFEVKNDAGQTVFAVYPKGVRIWVDESIVKDKAAGSRGGFAVGNLSTGKEGEEFFRVTRDSIRINFSESAKTKAAGSRGGFAVGNLSTGKNQGNSTMQIRQENYFIGHDAGDKTTGVGNVFFGYKAGEDNVGGLYNLFTGYYAGRNNIGGDANVFLGNYAGYYNTEGNHNVSIGFFAGLNNRTGEDNIYIGNYAGAGSGVIGGSNNTFLGVWSGYNVTTGSHNCLIGYNAGKDITEGTLNVALGDSAGYELTTGVQNTFVGAGAGVKVSTGHYNTNLGYWAGIGMNGYGNTFVGSRTGGGINANGIAGTGGYNVSMGLYSLYDLTSGARNTILGSYAGNDLSTGEDNVFIGYKAGGSYVQKGFPIVFEPGNNGTGNVFIGKYAGAGGAFDNYSDKLIIHNAKVDSYLDNLIYGDFASSLLYFNAYTRVSDDMEIGGDNSNYDYDTEYLKIEAQSDDWYVGVSNESSYLSTQFFIGTSSLETSTPGILIEYDKSVKVGGYTATTSRMLYVNGYAQASAWYTSSDKRWKKNIKPLNSSLDKVLNLKGVSYDWRVEEFADRNFDSTKQVGFIAQEVLEVVPELVSQDEDGFYSVDYVKAVPILVEAIKEQQKQIEKQQADNEELKVELNEIKKLQKQQTELRSEIEKLKEILGASAKK